MKEKINVALIYKSNYVFLSGKHFDNTTYYFFMHALKRNPKLNVTYFPCEKNFDVSKLLTPYSNAEQFHKLSNPDQTQILDKNDNIKVEAKWNIQIPKVLILDKKELLHRYNDSELIEKKNKTQSRLY